MSRDLLTEIWSVFSVFSFVVALWGINVPLRNPHINANWEENILMLISSMLLSWCVYIILNTAL